VNSVCGFSLEFSQILTIVIDMKITIITLFPELFDGFLHASKMDRAIVDGYITVDFINPRDFCTDRHQQVDDEIYG
jgi:tRNA (guanine37-N1)-methyltransferase